MVRVHAKSGETVFQRMRENNMQTVSGMNKRSLAVACLSAAWLAVAPAAYAQSPAPNAPAQAQPQVQPSNISDQKLDATAAALEKVTDVKKSYEQKITSAAPAEKERIASEAQGELSKAVTDQGLSVEEYNSIIQVAQNDPQIREKILQRVKKK